jgi:hypothetical protein
MLTPCPAVKLALLIFLPHTAERERERERERELCIYKYRVSTIEMAVDYRVKKSGRKSSNKISTISTW